MKLTIIRPTVCDGKDVAPGQTVDANESDYNTLIGIKKAVPYVEPEKKQVEKPEKKEPENKPSQKRLKNSDQ